MRKIAVIFLLFSALKYAFLGTAKTAGVNIDLPEVSYTQFNVLRTSTGQGSRALWPYNLHSGSNNYYWVKTGAFAFYGLKDIKEGYLISYGDTVYGAVAPTENGYITVVIPDAVVFSSNLI